MLGVPISLGHPTRQDGCRVTSQSKRSFPIQCLGIRGWQPPPYPPSLTVYLSSPPPPRFFFHQRMYFRLPRWLRSLSFWFGGDREKPRGGGNNPLGRMRVKTKTYIFHPNLKMLNSYGLASSKHRFSTFFKVQTQDKNFHSPQCHVGRNWEKFVGL